MVYTPALNYFDLTEMNLSTFIKRFVLYTVLALCMLFATDTVTHAQDNMAQYSIQRAYDIEHRISVMEAKLDSLQWLMGFVLTGTVTLVGELILRIMTGRKPGP